MSDAASPVHVEVHQSARRRHRDPLAAARALIGSTREPDSKPQRFTYFTGTEAELRALVVARFDQAVVDVTEGIAVLVIEGEDASRFVPKPTGGLSHSTANSVAVVFYDRALWTRNLKRRPKSDVYAPGTHWALVSMEASVHPVKNRTPRTGFKQSPSPSMSLDDSCSPASRSVEF